MDDNTALLWSLLAEITEWALRAPQRMDATSPANAVNYARNQIPQDSTAPNLARELVQALASPDRRGLSDTLGDIQIKIGEAPPSREQLVEAIDAMHRYAHGEGDVESYELARRTGRRFLNNPPKELV